jgi:nucleotide-binding universal stress UspA family protein
MTTVLLALDESPEAVAAARRAHDLFGSDATYLAVNVAEQQPGWTMAPLRWGMVYSYPPVGPHPLGDQVADPSTRARDDAIETARAAVDEAGIAAAAVGEVGDPAAAILAAADEHRADVIVTGTTDKGWWRRLIDPSVSQELIRESPVPVLVVSSAGRAG